MRREKGARNVTFKIVYCKNILAAEIESIKIASGMCADLKHVLSNHHFPL